MITKLFKTTIQNHLKPKKPDIDTYNKSVIYQMKCNECPLKYIGQIGRNFRTSYKQHIQAIQYNRPNSKYSEHILDTQHTYSTQKTQWTYYT
jgi:MinD-like ATPase involved in chromosome partitioning or flagellar assembly